MKNSNGSTMRVLPILAALILSAALSAKSERPNIILFLTDDLGWGDSKVQGHPYLKTPNIDRIAAGGIRFNNFYVGGSVCSPTRASFQTGRFPGNVSIHRHFDTPEKNREAGMPSFLDPFLPQVSHAAKEAGYKTAHFGKWHLCSGRKDPDVPNPSYYGFDDFRVYGNFVDVNKKHLFGNWRNKEKYPHHRDDPKYTRAYSSQYILDETIRFMEENKGAPVYINAWTLVPHATLHPTPEELAVYASLDPDMSEFSPLMQEYIGGLQDVYKRLNPEMERQPERIKHYESLTPEKVVERMKIYFASVTGLDEALGSLIDELHRIGEADNTLVFFTSDNGPEDVFVHTRRGGMGSAGPLRGRKRASYEGGVRVPGIAYWPGAVPAGRVDDISVLSSNDWFPTVCKLMGVEFPLQGTEYIGEDITEILKGTPRERNATLFWEGNNEYRGLKTSTPPKLAIRKGKWKLLMEADGSRVELFDIPNDPSESHNLAESNQDLVSELRQELLQWKGSHAQTAPKSEYKGAMSSKGTYIYENGEGTYR